MAQTLGSRMPAQEKTVTTSNQLGSDTEPWPGLSLGQPESLGQKLCGPNILLTIEQRDISWVSASVQYLKSSPVLSPGSGYTLSMFA